MNGISNSGEYTYFAHDGDFISFDIPSFDNPDEAVSIDIVSNNTGGSFSSTGFHETGQFNWQTQPGNYGVYTFTVQVCDQNVCVNACQTYIFTIIITCPQCPLDVYYENRSLSTTPLPSFTKAPRKIVAGFSVDPTQTDGPVIVDAGENVTFEAGVLVDLQAGFSVTGGTFIAQIVPGTCIDECDDCCAEWTGFTYDFIPNVFSPNGDGVNDVWYIPDNNHSSCAYNANGFELTIYDRWGCPVYARSENNNYCCPFNSGHISWNGYANTSCTYSFIEHLLGYEDSYSGQRVSDGVYYYILKFKIAMGSCYHESAHTGDITIFGGTNMVAPVFESENANELVQPDGTAPVVASNNSENDHWPKPDFNIYPNPATDNFTILVNNDFISKNALIEIFDASGRIIFTEPLVSAQKIINFSSYSTGFYFVKVSGNGYSQVKTLVKN